MPASSRSVKNEVAATMRRTARDKGWELPITVTVYDTWMIAITSPDRGPINQSPQYDESEGWLGVHAMISEYLLEFRKQVKRRAAV